jgi:hypothetical protein
MGDGWAQSKKDVGHDGDGDFPSTVIIAISHWRCWPCGGDGPTGVTVKVLRPAGGDGPSMVVGNGGDGTTVVMVMAHCW